MSRYLLPHAAVVAFCCSFFCSNLHAQAVPVISATKQDTFTPNGVGKALPGTNITYTTKITNTGTANATGVTLADAVPTLTTLGSVHASPLAANDVYTAIGNTKLYAGTTAPVGEPHTTSATNLTTNDTMFTSPDTIVLTAFTGATTQGGSVTVNADGTFTYTPPVGFAGADTFTYTAKNSAVATLTDTAVVTINVSNVVWYVDSSLGAAGNGTSATPFNALTNLNGAGGAGDVDNINQTIFLYDGTYTGGLTLEDGQTLIGQQHGLTISSIVLVSPGGGVSTINGGLILANGNTIQGVSLGDNAGFALSGGAVGTTVMNTLTAGSINNTTGGAVSITTSGALNMVFTSVSSTNSTGAGISLVNCTGTFTGNGGAINTATGADVNLNAGNLNFTYDGTITDDLGTLVSITGQTGGTKDFNGAITDGNNANGSGISLTSNTGAIISFDGGVILSTGANNAFAATGGGTVTVTGSANTIVTTTGTALNVANTTIGASGLTFRSISANGATNGIVLNTTGASGGLTVTGNSSGNGGGLVTVNTVGTAASVTAPDIADLTGGTIQNCTGAGISLNSTKNVSLTRMRILNSGTDGIIVSNINGFTLARSFISDSSGVAGDKGIEMGDFSTGTAVNGAINITNSTVGPTPHDNFGVGIGSGSSTWNITGSVFTGSVLNSGFNFEIRNATVSSFLIDGCVFQNQFADGMQMQPASGVNATVTSATIQNSTFQTNNLGMDLNHDGTSNVTYKVLANTFLNQITNSINFFSSAVQAPTTGGTLNGRFVGNVIGNAAVFNSGGGVGIRININGGADATVLVDSNTIRQVPNGRGIDIVSRNGTGGLDATITNNFVNTDYVSTVQNGGFSLSNIFLQSNALSVANTLRADIHGNTVPSVAPTGELVAFQLVLLETGASTFQLVDNGVASANATAEVQSQNTGSAGANAGVSLIAGPITTPPLLFSPSEPENFNFSTPDSVESAIAWTEAARLREERNTVVLPAIDAPDVLLKATSKSEAASNVLSRAQLDSLVSAARTRWEATDLNGEQLEILNKLTFSIADLPGWHLGQADGNIIRISKNAGGNNWFIDPTPADDSEFSREAAVTRRACLAEDPALNRVDLLTTLMHEMGHALGLSDRYDMKDRDSIMFGMLSRGERRLPAKGEASGAQAFDDGKSRFMGADIVIGTLPPGKSVTIQATVLIDDPVPAGTTQVSSQGRVFGTNFTKVNGSLVDNIAVLNTNDPDTGAAIDATITPVQGPPLVTNITSTTTNASYTTGTVIPVTVTFDIAVNVTGSPQLTLETGATDRVVNYSSGSGTNTLTFNYTVQAGDTTADLDYASTIALALNSGTIRNSDNQNAVLTLPALGAAGSLGINKNIVIDTTAPTVASVNSSTGDGSYKTGDSISIQVNFNEAVNVTGTPQLTLETGATDRVVNYASGSGSNTLTFTYTVQAGDTSTDLDYLSTTALALNSGTIRDAATNIATLTLAAPGTANSLGNNKAIVIDTTAPTVASVNSSTGDGSYKAGDSISIQVNFSEAVNVTGTPQLTLETGTTDQVVNYASGSGTSTLTFTYTVQAGDTSTDLDYQSTTALALNGGSIRDAATNNATLTLAAPGAANSLGANKNIVIDTTAPTVTSISSNLTNSTFKVGDVISIQVYFSEAVNVTGTPQLTLETGATDRTASYFSGSGTSTLTFWYSVQAGDVSADLDYQSTTALALNGGTLRDAASNNATLTLAAPGTANSLGSNKNIVIDGVAPTVTSVNSSTANGTYKAGDAISIQVNFSEAVIMGGAPQLTLETGTTDQVATYAGGTGSSTLTFTYTVQAGDTSADLDYQSTAALILNGGNIHDAAGNNATRTLASPGAANSLGANKNIVIDTTAPTVTSVNSSTANGTYKAGDAISIQVNFSEAVAVTGTPQLTLETGTTDQVINYASGSGTSALTFTYTVQAGDVSADLDYTSTTALTLNGGTIRDAVTNDATLTLAAPGTPNSLSSNKAIVIDGVLPTVTNVTSSSADGVYLTGSLIPVTVTFSEPVTVIGTPQLTLETGTTDQAVNYASGSGTDTLTFTYTVQAGDLSGDLDYTSTTSLALNGGTIRDAATNNATLTLPAPGAAGSLGNNKAIVIGLGITPNTAGLAQNATQLIISGAGFSPTPANNTVTLSSGTATVTGATSNQLTCTLDSQPSLGALNATVVVASIGTTGPTQVATIVAPPSVTPNTANLAINAATVIIGGTGFDAVTPANNTVVFNNSAVGNVTAATATSLTVTFSTPPAAIGSLTAVVTSFGGSSGAAVQVATVAPVITANATNLSVDSNTIVINGFGFSPTAANNTVTFNNGAVGTVTTSTPTTLNVTFSTHATTLGALSASVTVSSVGPVGPTQVTTIIPGAATHFTVSAPGTAIAGAPVNFTVTALDQFNFTSTGYTGTAHFTSTDGAATLPADYTFLAGDNGVRLFTNGATLQTGGSQTITATDTVTGSITGISASIAVGESVSIVATDNTAAVTGGDTGTYRFTRGGTGGSLVANFQLDVASTAVAAEFTLSGGSVTFTSGAGTVTFPNGSATVDVTLTTTANATGIAKPNKTVQFDVAAGSGYNIGAPASATVTIAQNGFVVFNTNDSGQGSLRQAIDNANTLLGNDVITFDPAVIGTITLTSGQLNITNDVTIQGPGANVLAISGNNASRVIDIPNLAINVTLNDLTICNGAVTDDNGAGIRCFSTGALTITRCAISQNVLTNTDANGEFGAGIYRVAGTLTMRDSTVSGNQSINGGAGGLFLATASTLTNCTFSGNSAVQGGALTFNTGPSSLVNVTITSNTATFDGGGIFLEASSVLSIGNSIVAGNTAPSQPEILVAFGIVTSQGNNLIGINDGSSGFFLAGSPNANNDIVGTSATPINPLLGPLANNGGPTQTHALLDGSPAINAGNNTLATNAGLTTDQRGAGYTRVQGGTVDIGALEALLFTPTLTNATTNEDVQSNSGLVITANTADAGGTTHYKITNIAGGTLFKNDGTTAIAAGSFITKAEGAAGLKFTPSANFFGSGGFDVQAAIGNTDADLRGSVVPAVVTVNAIADTPSVTNSSTTSNTQSTTGLVITRNPADGGEITHYKITAITNGSLFKHDGTTAITAGSFITTIEGAAGLKFTPTTAFIGVASFGVQASTSSSDPGLGGSVVTANINVGTPDPTIPVAPATVTTRNLQNGLSELVVTVRNTTAFDINGFRLNVNFNAYLGGFPTLKLYNATSPSIVSPPYVDYPFPVGVGNSVSLTLQFYTANRLMPNPFVPVLTLQSLPASVALHSNDTGILVTNIIHRLDGSMLLEFNTIPGKWYRVSYSNNLNTWYYSPVPIKAGSNKTQWIDNGPPGTDSFPVSSRFYQVSEIAAP